jgi:hypothetical protein
MDQERGAKSDWKGSAVDEAEVVRPSRHHRCWAAYFAEQPQRVRWIRRRFGERLIKSVESCERCFVRHRRPGIRTRYVFNGLAGGIVQQLDVVHLVILSEGNR